jgi:hypothetical protein
MIVASILSNAAREPLADLKRPQQWILGRKIRLRLYRGDPNALVYKAHSRIIERQTGKR